MGLLCTALSALSASACPLPRHVVVTQTGQLQLDDQTVTAAALSLPELNDEESRLLVFDARCRLLWSETIGGNESRFDVRVLGGSRLIEFVTLESFGDGTDYTHQLLQVHGRHVHTFWPIAHTGKDGFYLGRLAHGKGDGVVTWVADPTGEAEAAPHPYVVSTWTWRAGCLTGPVQYETKHKYLPSDHHVPGSNTVARKIGLPYRDQTGYSKFMDYRRVLIRLGKLSDSEDDTGEPE